MKNYIVPDEWRIIEDRFHPEFNRVSESLFSIGNGRMGQRANFEEGYGGESLQGHYVAGVYYPDKTRVGWWKNGYPEYFAKVLNAPSWIGIRFHAGQESVDLHEAQVLEFKRILDMREGFLERSCVIRLRSGRELEIRSTRFCSLVDDECGAIRYAVRPLNFTDKLHFELSVDGDIQNQDSNYGEKFWDEVNKEVFHGSGYVTARTKKTGFHVCTGMKFSVEEDGRSLEPGVVPVSREKYISNKFSLDAQQGKTYTICKYAAVVSSENHEKERLSQVCRVLLDKISEKGFELMLQEQARAWQEKWAHADIIIEGDISAQQGIRFNIFQLNQTYTGEDARLNIGPKGFTGEKYGGATYWDTEAYCLPFYLSNAESRVARNLLVYRYQHLPRAIENAGKLGFQGGAALYPMVTMNGEECHNEWEITFEEIHRNGAIAYAIHDYIRYTGDSAYLAEYGLEVLIGIARFWAQRVNYSEDKQQYVMLGVTGPNEYENNVNNNWYTSYLAMWCLEYAGSCIAAVRQYHPGDWERIRLKTNFQEGELAHWGKIRAGMYLPYDPTRRVYLQQDGFLDKELVPVKDLDPAHLPLNQKWSWDRILRSCYIKQADVLQGLYFFEERFDLADIRRNFDFYEPLTVHESSLSPCVHAILASRIGYHGKAYEMYVRTARLDLDDYNNDTEDGCHITSMAGTWMAVIKGFGGMRVEPERLVFKPYIPAHWKQMSFIIRYRGAQLRLEAGAGAQRLIHEAGEPVPVQLHGKTAVLSAGESLSSNENAPV